MLKAKIAPIKNEPMKMIMKFMKVKRDSLKKVWFSILELTTDQYMTIPIASLKIDSPKIIE